MATVVVPFRSGGKSRLPADVRVGAALAMLGDVLEAAAEGSDRVLLVTDDEDALLVAAELGVEVVADPGGGQGAGVTAALQGIEGPVVVVNADVPRVLPADIAALAAGAAAGALTLVAAADGTTNALGLPSPGVFRPLYGPGSAARFREHAVGVGLVVHDLDLPRLRDDVDTADDLERTGVEAGARTRALANLLRA